MEAVEKAQQLQHAQQSQHPQQLRQDDIQLLYKNRLHRYTQKAGLDTPMYHTKNTTPQNNPQFKCSVTVGEETYESLSTFGTKKAAEQDAAKQALKSIFEKRQEIGSSIIGKMTSSCKAILNELAAKSHIEMPIYKTAQTQQVPQSVFVSTVEFRGVSYTGGPALNKRDAEKLGAHAVIYSLLGNSEEDTTLLEIIKSKDKLFSSSQLFSTGTKEGSNSASDCGASSSQLVSGTSVLISTSHEEQSVDANKISASLTEGVPSTSIQNPAIPPIQTSANECSKVTSPSQTDVSVVSVPSSSQNPITPPMQVAAKEICKITSIPQARDTFSLLSPLCQNAVTPPVHYFANSPATQLQNIAHEGSKLTRAPETHGSVSLVPVSSQTGVTPPMRNCANQSCEITSVPQVEMSVFPGMPQKSTNSCPSSAIQGDGSLHYMAQPPAVPHADVPSVQDCTMSCVTESTKKRSRSTRRKANKRARMAIQKGVALQQLHA